MWLDHLPGRGLRATAGAMLAVEIAIHLALAPAHLSEMPYVGALFILASVLLAASLLAIVALPAAAAGWWLGAALCVGMGAGFVLSRAIGLPDYHEGWSSDGGLGLASLPPELALLCCALAAARRRSTDAGSTPPLSA